MTNKKEKAKLIASKVVRELEQYREFGNSQLDSIESAVYKVILKDLKIK